MRDVNNGWFVRYLHSNAASVFFFLVYLHVGRGMHFGCWVTLVGIHLMCPKLSNYGNTLKLLVLSHNWKVISGWTNYSYIVKNQKIQETKIGDRGSKSVTLLAIVNVTVKEQRVNGSCDNNLALRYILKGFKRNYPIRIPSNQINKQITRFYTSKAQQSNLQNFNLNPGFVTGFTDGEGCFIISITKNNNFKLRWKVALIFQISLHEKDKVLLEQVQNFFKREIYIKKHSLLYIVLFHIKI